MKKPIVAALLNIIPGLGYLYLGTRKVFAYLLLGGALAFIVGIFDPVYDNYDFESEVISMWDILGCILIQIAFVADAYYETKRINKSQGKSK